MQPGYATCNTTKINDTDKRDVVLLKKQVLLLIQSILNKIKREILGKKRKKLTKVIWGTQQEDNSVFVWF